jgi:putative Ca2+/H+ antiporter (TMEM165/GDT1 family)
VREAPAARFWPVFATSFGVVFVGEWGDITQLATANMVARYDDALSVGIGAALGLMAAAGLAVSAGARILRYVPLPLVRRIAGLLLAVLAIGAVVSAVR